MDHKITEIIAVSQRYLSHCSFVRFLSPQGLMASGSDLEVHSLPTQQHETDSVPKENGPPQEDAQSIAEVVDNSQPASL